MKFATVLCLATALCLPLALAGCNDEGVGGLMAGGPKEYRPIPLATQKLMDEKGMRREDPILIRVFKEENILEIWKRDSTNQYALLKSYNMCAWGGTIGPKLVEGDKMSPEGFYQITPGRMNPHSQFFLSMDLGYPNAFDRAYNRTGSAVMVHGNCTASAGCFVLTDIQVQEVYAIAREALAAGQSSFQVQAYPFRLTAANLARHRRNPNIAFWRNLKEGYDHFEVTHREPKVDVCEKKYVFDAHPVSADSTTFNPQGACPSYKVPEDIAEAVATKQKADEAEFKVQVAALDAQERAQAEAELAMKMEAAKPKPQPVNLLSVLTPKPADPAPSQVQPPATTVALASPGKLPVPVTRPTPLDTSPAPVASGYGAAEQPAGGDVIGNFLSVVKLPDFGKKDEPAPSIAVTPPAAPAPKAAPAAAAVKPATGATASATPPASQTQPVTTPPARSTPAVAPAEDIPWWKKLNPFGG